MYFLAYLNSIALKVVKIDHNNWSVFYSIKVITFQKPMFYFNTNRKKRYFFLLVSSCKAHSDDPLTKEFYFKNIPPSCFSFFCILRWVLVVGGKKLIEIILYWILPFQEIWAYKWSWRPWLCMAKVKTFLWAFLPHRYKVKRAPD